MKVIQNALLYNKIECYNKGVQRSPSHSERLHSLLKTSTPLQVQDVGRAPKKGSSLLPLNQVTVDQVLRRPNVDYIMIHDVNIEEAHR